MVLIPRFTIEQTDSHIILRVRAPYVKISTAELLIEGKDFSFYCKPYLLKLTFPHEIHSESDLNSAKYDPDDNNGTLTINLCKVEHGLHFPDLDIITKLFTTKSISTLHDSIAGDNNIEVLHSEHFVDDDEQDPTKQSISHENIHLNISPTYSYGFNNQYSNIFNHSRDILLEFAEISNPEGLSPLARRAHRINIENQHFDAYRYLGDLTGGEEDPMFISAMSFQPFWTFAWDESKQKLNTKSLEELLPFLTKETEVMTQKLKPKEYLIPENSTEERSLLLNLIDVLFAFAYNHRMTEGEENNNPESAYNITKLSAVFSCFECYSPSFRDDHASTVIKFCMRRAVNYPYLRHWKLGRKVLSDVAKVLLLGRRAVLKCLLQLYDVFEHTETHYLLNKLYVVDYCTWIQTRTDVIFKSFGKEFNSAKNEFERLPKQGKATAGFHLPELEDYLMNVLGNKDNDETEPDEIPSSLLDYDSLNSSDSMYDYLRIAVTPTEEREASTTRVTAYENLDKLSETIRNRLQIVSAGKDHLNGSTAAKRVLIEEVVPIENTANEAD